MSQERRGRSKLLIRNFCSISLTVVLASVLAACGSAASDRSPAVSAIGKKAEAAGQPEGLSQPLKSYLDGTVHFPAFTPSTYNPGRGTVGYVALTMQDPAQAKNYEMLKEAAKAMGWTLLPAYDGEFQPNVMSALVDQLVIKKVNAIILNGINLTSIPHAVTNARKAGIPIACLICTPPKGPTEGVSYVGLGENDLMAAIVSAFISTLGIDRPKVILLHQTDLEQTDVLYDHQVKYFAANCPQCQLNEVAVTNQDASATGLPALTQMLRQYPPGSVDFIVTPYDLWANAVVQVARQLGRSDFKVFGRTGASPFIDMVKAGNTIAYADGVFPAEFMVWSALDLVARAAAKQPLWDAYRMPEVLVTAKNQDLLTGSTWLPNINYKKKFAEAWSG